MHGECISLIPAFYFADELASGAIVPILTDYQNIVAELSAYYRRSQHVPMKIRSFLNFILEKYVPKPPWQDQLVATLPHIFGHLNQSECEA